MNFKQINSLATNMIARWRKLNEEPRLGELILVEFIFDENLYGQKDSNGNFYTYVPKANKKDVNYLIGYLEKTNNQHVKAFVLFNGGIITKEVHKIPFTPSFFKRWIYVDEISYL